MNVFILDRDMEKSAMMLDDAHLKAQINEACQILMANYNKENYPDAKIGHINHSVTKYYADKSARIELFKYLHILLDEYYYRFRKDHQNAIWWFGFKHINCLYEISSNDFLNSKTYVNGIMTDDIEVIRKYISTKPQQKKPVWTNREKPEWWEV